MRVRVDRRFLDEVARFELRFTCTDCSHRRADGDCAHGWPNQEHRALPVFAQDESTKDLLFCKEFELV